MARYGTDVTDGTEDPNFGDQPFSKSHWKESPNGSATGGSHISTNKTLVLEDTR